MNMNKWEYGVVGPLRAYLQPVRQDTYCELWYLTGTGIQLPTHLNLAQFHQDNTEQVAQLIWLLGEEGWELVTSGSGVVELNMANATSEPGGESPKREETGHMLYFKRRKQE
jgi:hypothetical protein